MTKIFSMVYFMVLKLQALFKAMKVQGLVPMLIIEWE